MITTAVLYTRVSSDEQAREGVSLDAQLAECQRYAARHDWIIGTHYVDVLSGTRDDRPGYQQMLRDLRQLRAQRVAVTVVVAALDRLGRRLLERIRCRDELKSLGVPVHSVREGGEVSDLVSNVLGAVAQEEVRRLGERVQAAHDHVKARGWKAAGHPPWGYLRRPATDAERAAGAPKSVIDVDPDSAPIVRELFARAETTTVRQLGKWVHAMAPSARQGRALAGDMLSRVLHNPTYIARASDATGNVLASPLMAWPALVDEAQWLRVQAVIASHTVLPKQASGRYLLTGFLRCIRCGGRMGGKGQRARPNLYYQCGAERSGAGACRWGAPCAPFDTPVLAALYDLLDRARDPRLRAPLRRQWRELQQPGELEGFREKRRASLVREAIRARERLTNAALLLVDGSLDRAGYERVRDTAQVDLQAAEEEMARLGGTAPNRLPDVDTVLDMFVGQRPDDTVADQRALLGLLVVKVDATRTGYGRYEVRITWTAIGDALQHATQPRIVQGLAR